MKIYKIIYVLIKSGDAAIFNTNNNLPPLLLHKVSSEILNPLHTHNYKNGNVSVVALVVTIHKLVIKRSDRYMHKHTFKHKPMF